jgi:nucleoside-diphosphate-sugar epimerase
MILITGGNGLVGTRLALKLLRRSERVRILALAPAASDDILREAGAEILYGDVVRPGDLEAATRGVDTVFHLAAILSSPENPPRYRAINVGGTLNALAAAERNAVGHFVFVSSISVAYPRRNAYSASKAEAEESVRRSRVSWTIARPCLVLEGLEHQTFERAVLKWPVLLLPRRGAARKRPLGADDLAGALAKLAGDATVFGKTLELGGRETVSLRGMAASILRARGARRPVWTIPEGFLRAGASLAEALSRMLGRKISWLSHQSVDGLVYDAVPEGDGT